MLARLLTNVEVYILQGGAAIPVLYILYSVLSSVIYTWQVVESSRNCVDAVSTIDGVSVQAASV